MAVSTYLELHFHIYLVALYICIPITFLLLKCCLINNVPWKDFFFLFSVMITYSCFVWWILLFGKTIYCTDDCEDENYSTFDDYGDEKFASNDDYGDEKCPSINDCHPFNGLKGSYVNLYPLIAFPLFSCIITFIVEPLHAYHRHVGLSARHAVLPINFTPTPVATMQDLVDRIARTGPTIVAGVMQETSYEVRKGNRLSFWGLAGWEQFQYKTWAMVRHLQLIST